MRGSLAGSKQASLPSNNLTCIPVLSDFFFEALPARQYAFQAPTKPTYDDMLSVALLARYSKMTVDQLLSTNTLTISDAPVTSIRLGIGVPGGLNGDDEHSTFEKLSSLYERDVLKRQISNSEQRNAIDEIGKTLSLIRRGIAFDLPSVGRIGMSSEAFPLLLQTNTTCTQLYTHAGDLLEGALTSSKDDKEVSEWRAQALFGKLMKEAVKRHTIINGSGTANTSDIEEFFEAEGSGALLPLHKFCGPCLLARDFYRLRMKLWSDERLICLAFSIIETRNALHLHRQKLMKEAISINTDLGIWYLTSSVSDQDVREAFHCGANIAIVEQDRAIKMWKRPSVINKSLRSADIRAITNSLPHVKISADSDESYVHFQFEKFAERNRHDDSLRTSISKWCTNAGLASDEP